MNRTILHVDFNSYFASVEQQKNPYLRGKPVGVIKAQRRTVVIAASVEAKQHGIKTGITVFEAKQRCPEIILVPANFEAYDDTTRRFYAMCQKYSDVVELFSLDEVFLDVSNTAYLFGGATSIALSLKKDIKIYLGDWLTVSVGIAKNKLLAKFASDLEKPDGLVEINDENQDYFLSRAKFDQICGIGPRLEKRLKDMGVIQLLQIRQLPDGYLTTSFGSYWSKELKRLAWGEDTSPVIPSFGLPLPKSVSRTHTLFKNIFGKEEILAVVRNLVEEATEKLRLARMTGRQFGLLIRNRQESDALFVTRKFHSNDPLEVFREVKCLFERRRWQGEVRFLGVWISLLAEENMLTRSLLPSIQRRELILSAQDRINGMFGHYTLFPASLLRTQLIFPEVNGYLGDEAIKQRINQIGGGL